MQLNDAQLADILIKENYLTKKDLSAAQSHAKEQGVLLSEALFELKILNKEIFGEAIGEYFRIPFVDLKKKKIDDSVLHRVPEMVASGRRVIAFREDEMGVHVGFSDPQDQEIRDALEKLFGAPIVSYFVVSGDVDDALGRYKESLRDSFSTLIEQLKDDSLSKDLRDGVAVRVVDMLLAYGYQNKASDIHLEPYKSKMMIRFRIDGVMHDVLEIPRELYDVILTRIKILSRIRTDEHRVAQDGKLRFETKNEEVDVRVSIVPVTRGENVVLRLLAARSRRFDLQTLGLRKHDFEKVQRAIAHPHGMILVTGPTGSGKTTSLYAVIKILNKREVHLSTIEDPVEYDIEGISQIQVNTKTGLTFAKGLRALVRQDPDIIMVGEIRDDETAGIAVNSALTGHLVLSTLHTNDAATALPRLLDMGIEPFLVASTVNVIIAQRLVRKVCEKCRASYSLTDEEKNLLKHDKKTTAVIMKLTKKKSLSGIRLYKGNGCKVCGDTGYTGRVGVFEVLEMSDTVRPLILRHASSDEIVQVAKEDGMTTMLEDGVDKALNGITTLEEVLRVTRE